MARRMSMVSGVANVQRVRRARNTPSAYRPIPRSWRRINSISNKCVLRFERKHQSSRRIALWLSKATPSNPNSQLTIAPQFADRSYLQERQLRCA